MRQGQPQNRQRSRGRGNNNNRNNNNRNQLNRSMESNGPDVRIRGTAAHIAEKYSQLASDAQTTGDTVAAQSYWQFAEHYNRLVAQAQAAMQQAKEEQEARREARGESSGEGEESGDGRDDNRNDRQRGRGRGRGRDRDRDANEVRSESDKQGDDNSESDGNETTADAVQEAKPRRTRKPRPVAADIGEGPQPDVEEFAAATDGEEEAPKPRRAKRPRKADAPVAASEDAAALPSFLTGE